MTQRVLLFDTSSLFFRAYHALPPMNASNGQPTSAIYGLSVQWMQWMREQTPLGIGFALDAPKQTFRHEDFAGYKAQRPLMPDALRRQLPLLERWLEALAVPSFRVPGFEADDVLATVAHELGARDHALRVVTGDRDLFQVVRPTVDVLFIGRRGQKPIVYDVASVERRFGVAVAQLPSFMALTGDRSDNLPGLPGIGLRTAAKLITRFGDITQLLDSLRLVTPDSLRTLLAGAREQLLRNERLARLRVDAPLGVGPRFSAVTPAAYQRLRTLFEELEFKSLLARVDRLIGTASPE